MEKAMLEKLSEIANILFVAHQKIEQMQKILFVHLKRAGKLPDLDKKNNFENKSKHNGS